MHIGIYMRVLIYTYIHTGRYAMFLDQNVACAIIMINVITYITYHTQYMIYIIYIIYV